VITRREFLEVAAVAAVPAIAGAAQRADEARTNPVARGALHTALIDERFVEARTVGVRLAASGVMVRAMPDGDVTQIWLNHIGPAWRDQPVTIAGLTARPALFCLEQFALSCGLRVVYHGEHVVHQEGRTGHRILRGAQAARIGAQDLALAGRSWPTLIAQVLAAPPHHAGHGRFGRSEAALNPTVPPGAQLLTSWIITAA
jgi:hypothetical protein